MNHGYLLLKESELNDKLAKYKKRVDISYDNGIFYDQIENISSGEKYLISNKVSIVDNSRKIDFVGHVFSDLKYRRVENNYIQSIFDNIVEIKDGLVKKINHE